MGKTPTLKGSILREFLLYYERRFGADALRAIAADLPAEVASKLDVSRPALGILPSQSYPCAEVYPIIEAICAGWSRPDFRAFVREAADESLGGLARGVYRFIAETIVSPALLVRAMPRIWTLIHSTGARRARLLDAGSAEVIIEGWAGHHPLICELTSETSAGMFRYIGCRDVTAERAGCVSTGAPVCTTIFRWKP